jgi:exopolyphosphatase / guanosine-5'-triphosphate,3'-diphosphate pyrophosphatase
VRIAVVDIGTNSTRLLVADVENGRVDELERDSTVTRLGRGVDTSRQLSAEAIENVCDAVGDYIGRYEALGAERVVAIATSAVRDAENSGMFMAELRERFALDAHILDGAEEARLTYLGAIWSRPDDGRTLVIDIGGGSTELIVGHGRQLGFYASLQAGTVRHTERYLTSDPPDAAQLEDLAEDVGGLIDDSLRTSDFARADRGLAVAGTPTSLAAIDQRLDPYDPDRVHGYRLALPAIQHMLSELAAKPLAERLQMVGLHPGRAPTIVAGVVILVQAMRAFGLSEIEVSEHDILWGAALSAAGDGRVGTGAPAGPPL